MHQRPCFFITVVFIAATISGCNSGDGKANEPAAINKPNTDYKPAFEGQTRIKEVTTTTPYKVEKIAEKLGRPWAIIALPDGRLLITEKSGFMAIYSAEGAFIKKITGFPTVNDKGQGGMLDVALDPAFEQNKTIYWAFSEKQQDSTNLT